MEKNINPLQKPSRLNQGISALGGSLEI